MTNTHINITGDEPRDSSHHTTNTKPAGTMSMEQWTSCERCKANGSNSSIPRLNSSVLAYGLILLLFIWNAELWSQVGELRSELRVLKLKLEDSKEYNPSNLPHSQRFQIMTERATDEQSQSSQIRSSPKVKRSTLRENSATGAILQRLKRSARTKSDKKKRKRPGKTKIKRRCKGKKVQESPVPPISTTLDTQATAIHVMIKGTPPYRGRPLAGHDGVIRQWETAQGYLWNQGFDVSSLNATDDSAGVTVKKTGVYYFYGQVAFSLGTGIDFHERIEIGVSHRMMDLASCVNYPVSRSTGDSDLITCHSSGIARMEKGWKFRLSIYPSYLHVYNDPRYTYFGAFFIGNSAD